MDNKTLIKNINANQLNEDLHPMTCGCRESLLAVEEDNAVILICPACGYKQISIPPAYLKIFNKER